MVKLLTLDEISQYLKDKRMWVVSRRSGLSYPTIKKLKLGRAPWTKKPYCFRTDIIERISEYIVRQKETGQDDDVIYKKYAKRKVIKKTYHIDEIIDF